MKLYMTSDLWMLVIGGLALLAGVWFVPKKSALSKYLYALLIIGIFSFTIWGPDEYLEHISTGKDGRVVVAVQSHSRDWAFRPKYALKVNQFSPSGHLIQTHSIHLPERDYYSVNALQIDAAGNMFIGVTPESGQGPLLIKTDKRGRVLWTAGTGAAKNCALKIDGSAVTVLGVAPNETELINERFDVNNGKPLAHGNWALSLWETYDSRLVCPNPDGGALVNTGNPDQPILSKLTPDGRMVWKTPVRNVIPSVLYTDAGDYHYLGGQFENSASISRYSRSGDLLWVRKVLPPEPGIRSVTTDIESVGESILVFGVHLREIRPSPQLSYDHRAFIAKLSPSGKVEWHRILEGKTRGYDLYGETFAVDVSGNAYVANGRNKRKIALHQYDSTGRFRWKALAPDPAIVMLVIAMLAAVIDQVRLRRQKRSMRESPIQP